MTTQVTVNRPFIEARGKNAALWVMQTLLSGFFIMAGSSALAGGERVIQTFNAVGLGQWARYTIGSIEVVSALLLFAPRLAGIGATLLSITMVFAIIALRSIPGQSFLHAIVLLPLLIVALSRKES